MLELHDLRSADRPALLQAWEALFGRSAPKGISRAFLRRFIAFELQAQRQGGLTRETRRLLASPSASQPAQHAKLGTEFFREWNGVTHRVELTDTGYVWNGEAYRSLSAVAKAITGAHWSGPRFFGLRDAKSS